MMKAGYKDRVRVYIAFYNYLGVVTEMPQIAEFRNFNWAKTFIPTAREWLTEVGSNSKVVVEVFDEEYNAFRKLTDDELKARMEEDNEH